MKTAHLLFAIAIATPQAAMAITKCVTPSGDVVFTDLDCPTGSTRAGEIQYKSPPSSGLREGERRALDRIDDREAEQRADKRYERQRDERHRVTYSDRKRIRELEMEKGALSKSLTRGSKSYGETSAIRSQIRGIDRQIEQIRAPKW